LDNSASFTSSKVKDLCQNGRALNNFSRRLQAVRNRDGWVFWTHWRT